MQTTTNQLPMQHTAAAMRAVAFGCGGVDTLIQAGALEAIPAQPALELGNKRNGGKDGNVRATGTRDD